MQLQNEKALSEEEKHRLRDEMQRREGEVPGTFESYCFDLSFSDSVSLGCLVA